MLCWFICRANALQLSLNDVFSIFCNFSFLFFQRIFDLRFGFRGNNNIQPFLSGLLFVDW